MYIFTPGLWGKEKAKFLFVYFLLLFLYGQNGILYDLYYACHVELGISETDHSAPRIYKWCISNTICGFACRHSCSSEFYIKMMILPLLKRNSLGFIILQEGNTITKCILMCFKSTTLSCSSAHKKIKLHRTLKSKMWINIVIKDFPKKKKQSFRLFKTSFSVLPQSFISGNQLISLYK